MVDSRQYPPLARSKMVASLVEIPSNSLGNFP